MGAGETILLAKYTRRGVLAWVRTGTGDPSGMNRGFGVAVEPSTGSVYLTGMAQTTALFTSGDNAIHSIPGPWTWHMFLAKFDAPGNFQWGQWNEASPNSVPQRVAVDSADNAYVVGWFEYAAFLSSADNNGLTVYGYSHEVQNYPDYSNDAFVAKYDKNGNVKWVNHIGG